jgi:hypothetical protein
MRLKALLIGAAAVVAFAIVPARAGAVVFTLEELLTGSVTVGDKEFSNFTFDVLVEACALTGSGDPACAPLDAADINVEADIFNGLEGLRFSGDFFAAAGSSLQLLIGYDVTVLDPGMLITDIHLAFNGAAFGSGSFAQVTETVFAADVQAEVIATTEDLGGFEILSDIEIFPGAVTVSILKDIILEAGVGGFVAIGFIDQLVTQAPAPEPSLLLLLGAGLVSLATVQRLRRRS